MFSNYPIPNGLPVTPVHSHRFLSHVLRWLYFTSQWRAAMCAAGKTKSTMTATGDIQNNCPGSLIKHLPLTADLPAPADLPSIDHYSNGDLM